MFSLVVTQFSKTGQCNQILLRTEMFCLFFYNQYLDQPIFGSETKSHSILLILFQHHQKKIKSTYLNWEKSKLKILNVHSFVIIFGEIGEIGKTIKV